MNDQTSNSKSEQPNAMRRRLTKGGLATPVVLASLASKPVLADFNLGGGVPWVCTLSGQLSGNMSGHENEFCELGTSHAGLGSYHNRGVTIKTQFGMTEDLIFVFNPTPSNMTLDSGSLDIRPATIGEALDANYATTAEQYAQRALVILLNAEPYTDTSNYPLTKSQAINLFVAACKQQNFVDTNPNINWSYERLKAYIDVIYR